MRNLSTLFAFGLLAALSSAALLGAVEPNPSAAAAAYQQGREHARLGQDDQAATDFQRAIQLDPTRFEYTKALDDVLARRGQWDAVVDAWTSYIELQPNNARAYCERGGAFSHAHDLNRAASDADKACSLGDQECCQIAASLRERFPNPPPPVNPNPKPTPQAAAGVPKVFPEWVLLIPLALVLSASFVFAIASDTLKKRQKSPAAPHPRPVGALKRPLGAKVIVLACFLVVILDARIFVESAPQDTEGTPYLVLGTLTMFIFGVCLWKMLGWARVPVIIISGIQLMVLTGDPGNVKAAADGAGPFFEMLGAAGLFAWFLWYTMLSPRGVLAYGPSTKAGKREAEGQATSPAVPAWDLPAELRSSVPRALRENQTRSLITWRTVKDLAKYAIALGIYYLFSIALYDSFLAAPLAEHRLDWRAVSLALVSMPALWPGIAAMRSRAFSLRVLPQLLQSGTVSQGEVTALNHYRLGKEVRFRFPDGAGKMHFGSLLTRESGLDLRVGEKVTVLYDPRDPRRNALYPLEDYSVAAAA